jgi:hypothetical protein
LSGQSVERDYNHSCTVGVCAVEISVARKCHSEGSFSIF